MCKGKLELSLKQTGRKDNADLSHCLYGALDLAFVGTVRLQGVPDGHPLMSFISAVRRSGQLTEIAIGPLTETETALLAADVIGCELEPALATELYQATGGNSLFTLEIAQAGLPGRAILYYIRAGDAARRVYANASAINHYQHALTLMPEQERLEVMLKLGEMWKPMGNWARAEAILRQALELARALEDSHAQAECEAALGEMLQTVQAAA